MKISEYIFFHTTKILFDLCIKEVKLSLVFQIGKNNTFHDYPIDRSIHSFFDDMAKTIPDNIAVEFEDKRITYRELNNLADRIASILVSRGINAGKVAAVITERSFNMIAAILAVLKSGAAYLPIEPGIPDERKKYYLKTAGASVILSNADSKKLFDLPNINIDKLPDNSIPYIAASVPSENPAYIIFTSGSTGSTKGVMVCHYSVVNRLLWMKEQYMSLHLTPFWVLFFRVFF